jgi:hypothetical protein
MISDEYMTWHRHGVRHRDEHQGPAQSWRNKLEYTYWNAGLIHRARGPATCYYNVVEWWWYGVNFESNMDAWADRANIDPELFVVLKLKYG